MGLLHTFASNLKKHRVSQGFSQEKLAALAGLHRTYISAVEREQRNISIANIERIAAVLGIEAYMLLQEKGE